MNSIFSIFFPTYAVLYLWDFILHGFYFTPIFPYMKNEWRNWQDPKRTIEATQFRSFTRTKPTKLSFDFRKLQIKRTNHFYTTLMVIIWSFLEFDWSYCVLQNRKELRHLFTKERHTGLERHEGSKWWQNCHFLVNCPFKIPSCISSWHSAHVASLRESWTDHVCL